MRHQTPSTHFGNNPMLTYPEEWIFFLVEIFMQGNILKQLPPKMKVSMILFHKQIQSFATHSICVYNQSDE